MIIKWKFCILQLFIICIGVSQSYKRVCYFTNWAQYRNAPYKFFPGNIDPFLCTHIIYSFGKVEGNNIEPYEWNDESTEWSKGNYEKTVDLKLANPKLKVLLAIGGWTHGTDTFTEVVSTTGNMVAFADNAIEYLRRINFDGLDLDWEYPANRGSPPEDRERFTTFCQILRAKFEEEAKQTGNPQLLLTAAVAAGESTVKSAYEIAKIAEELDFINLMSYDLHGSWENFTGHNSPLYARSDEIGEQRALNQGGTPREKLIMGLGLYGRSFKMGSSSHTFGSPASGAGTAGTFTREAGFMAYYEVCTNLKTNGWTRVWNDEHKVPYAYKGDQWVGYDDLESFRVKANYIKDQGLGGSMVWAVDLDDFQNSCGNGVYPLMGELLEMLPEDSGGESTKSTTQAPVTTKAPTTQAPTTKAPTQAPTTKAQTTKALTTKAHMTQASTTKTSLTHAPTTKASTQAPTTKSPTTQVSTTKAPTTQAPSTQSPTTQNPGQCGPPADCGDQTYFTDACDDTIFYHCANGIPYKKTCQTGLVWDSDINACNWPSNLREDTCAPSSCVNGQYYSDSCDDSVYYLCANNIAYKRECDSGAIWNSELVTCMWKSD